MARPVEHNFKSLRAQGQQNTPVSEPQSHSSQYLARLCRYRGRTLGFSPWCPSGSLKPDSSVYERTHSTAFELVVLGSLGSLSGFVIL